MNPQSLAEFEQFCARMYETSDPVERQQAEQALVAFADTGNCLVSCEYILQNSTFPYAQVLSASSVTRHIGKYQNIVSTRDLLHIRDFGLSFLAHNPNVLPFVLFAVCQMIVRSIKLGWYAVAKSMSEIETHDFASLAPIEQFLRESPQHQHIGARIFAELVTEMNSGETGQSITRHRNISAVFRDKCLRDIFELCVSQLTAHFSRGLAGSEKIIELLLQAAHTCLNFDFIGTSPDESSDESGSVHVPSSWRPLFIDQMTLRLFFGLYGVLPAPVSAMAMECLVQLSSVRRSLFSDEERKLYLTWIMNGIQSILVIEQGLSDQSNYHQFCRLLARIKSNYQLMEICSVDNYTAIVDNLATFTLKSIESWHWSPNSIHYLLSMWHKMVNSIPYVKSANAHYLENYTPRITEAYIRCHIQSVPSMLDEQVENPLLDLQALHVQLEQFAIIARCQFEKTCKLVIEFMDSLGTEYEALILQNMMMSPDRMRLLETQLAWLVNIIAAIIGGRNSVVTADAGDVLDGELVCRVLQLMAIVAKRDPAFGSEDFELALVFFLNQFRKTFIGDAIQKASKVYQPLAERLNIKDQPEMLNAMIDKIVANLKNWSNSERIIETSLDLLTDLTMGYSSVRQLHKLDISQFLLSNHSSATFRFLDILSNSRLRTTYYASLGRLLLSNMPDEVERIEEFMNPFKDVLMQLRNAALHDPTVFLREDTRRAVIGLARDLRGFVCACTKRNSFVAFFDWFYPEWMPVILQALQACNGNPSVTNPILKFWCELVHNRSQRVQFELSSANGILLFRETSRVLVAYGQAVLSMPPCPPSEAYPLKYKGIATCFNMLKNALSGGYVNFGVFRLYNDDALDNALQIFLSMLKSCNISDLLNFPKVSKAYFSLLEVFTQDHLPHMLLIDDESFTCLMTSISEGLKSINLNTRSSSCTCLDNILKFHFKAVQKAPDTMPVFSRLLHTCPTPWLQDLLSMIFNAVAFEDSQNTWSMSRPLLVLILMFEDYFNNMQERMIAQQPLDRQNTVKELFVELMADVERTLAPKNRDKFTQNLTLFRSNLVKVAAHVFH